MRRISGRRAALVTGLVLVVVAGVLVATWRYHDRTGTGPPPDAVERTHSDHRVSDLPTPSRPGDDRPNVVVVLTDDMRADEMRYLPQTRRLLRGTTFTNAISSHPLCCPARAMLHTGRYAQNNGVRANRGPRGGFQALLDPTATAAHWLQESGYLTALHGKYLNGYHRDHGRQVGWDVWDPLVGPPSRYTTFDFFDGDHYADDYITTRIAQRGEATVRAMAGAGSPFYLFVNHTAPHETVQYTDRGIRQVSPTPDPTYAHLLPDAVPPSFAAPSYDDLSGWRKGYGRRASGAAHVKRLFLGRIRSLRSVDDAVASLVATLRETGELDNTYVVLTSDNGFALGEHTYTTKNLVARESLAVPLLVSGPGVPVQRVDAPTSLLDIPATVVDLAGVRPPVPMDGASLLPFLRGRPPSGWRTTTLVQTSSNRSRGALAGWRSRGVTTDRYLYAVDVTEPGYAQLYDHRTDPYEMRNLADDPRYRQVRAELDRRLRVLETCVGPQDCNRPFPPLPPPRPPRAG